MNPGVLASLLASKFKRSTLSECCRPRGDLPVQLFAAQNFDSGNSLLAPQGDRDGSERNHLPMLFHWWNWSIANTPAGVFGMVQST